MIRAAFFVIFFFYLLIRRFKRTLTLRNLVVVRYHFHPRILFCEINIIYFIIQIIIDYIVMAFVFRSDKIASYIPHHSDNGPG